MMMMMMMMMIMIMIMDYQKTAISGTAHILRKVLMEKYKTYFMGETTLHIT